MGGAGVVSREALGRIGQRAEIEDHRARLLGGFEHTHVTRVVGGLNRSGPLEFHGASEEETGMKCPMVPASYDEVDSTSPTQVGRDDP